MKSVLLASCFVAYAAAQSAETSAASSVEATATASQAMPPAATEGFNPNLNVSSTQKSDWCLGQRNNCPQICGGSAAVNQCDETTLTYSCTCPNGTAPDCTAFIDTLPFYICLENFKQCIDAHPNDSAGQRVCQDNEQCGTRNATAERLGQQSGSASGSASATASESSSGSATAASSGASATSSDSSASSNTIASGAFAALFVAAFKLLL